MNEYLKQAVDFLQATNTELTVEYLYTGPYFGVRKKFGMFTLSLW
jgi:hypothetical protein